MATSQEIKIQVMNLLKSLSVCIPNSSNTQWTVRCPYCGDSSDLSHGHLSIKVDTSDDSDMVFRCFKCNTAGLLTPTVLEDLQLNVDQGLYHNFKEYNKKRVRYNKFNDTYIPDYKVPICDRDNKLAKIKLEYLNRRLGTNFDIMDASQLKIILDFNQFIAFNKIEAIDGISWKQIKFLNYNYIGFLSCNNNQIVFRNIYPNENRRYMKVVLNQSLKNPASFYSIPNSIDLMYTNKIDIHIAEGTFDILSIYSNVNKSNLKNHYYFAACGFGYTSVLSYLIYTGLNTGLTIHIYSDKDKSDYNHREYIKKLDSNIGTWFDRIFIHRNQFPHEKDYGVPGNFIEDSKYKIR